MVATIQSSCPLDIVKSLAELAHAAKLATSAVVKDKEGDVELAEMYDRMHEKYLGRRPRHPSWKSVPVVRAMRRCCEFCEEHKLDPALFVAAQMATLADYCRSLPYGFQPGMLTSEKALGRYNAYVRRTGREFHRAAEDVLRTPETRLSDVLFEGEVSVGAYYCAAALTGTPVTWLEAVAAAHPGSEWRACEFGLQAAELTDRLRFVDYQRKHGDEWIARLKKSARLNAAVVVVDRYRYGLSEYLGLMGAFTWEALAIALIRVLGPRHRPQTYPSAPGVAWGAGRVAVS